MSNEKTCKTCKWAEDWYDGEFSCLFPLPAWLKSAVIHLENKRTEDYVRLNKREANEFTRECCWHNCPTWELKGEVSEPTDPTSHPQGRER